MKAPVLTQFNSLIDMDTRIIPSLLTLAQIMNISAIYYIYELVHEP